MRTVTNNARGGFVLPAVIGALVIIALLITAGFFVAQQELRMGVANRHANMAFNIAQAGANEVLDNWNGFQLGSIPIWDEAVIRHDFGTIGEWEVTTPAREGWTASSSITVANNGCSIHEDYLTQGGYAGRSINFYDPQKKKWHQTWTDNQGAPLYLEGGLVDGAMVLTDATSRVTWSTLADGRVRQHWESTSDGGKTYTTAFDGYYRRK